MEYLDQIICGDCLEILSQIPDNTVHLAVTSPPYNLGLNYDTHNDNLEYQHYLDWLKKVWIETERVLVPGGRFALNIAPTSIKNFKPIHHDFGRQLGEIGLIFRTEILWYKQTMGRRTAWGSWKSPANPHIVPSWEYILVFNKGSWRLAGNQDKADITADEFKRFSDGFWYIPPESQRRGHPAPFPEELIYRLIKFYTYKENVVLDMFGGTGTVAVVAYKTGRHFVHIDLSSQYCATAAKRLEVARAAQELPITVSKTGKQVSARFVFRNGNHKEKPKRATPMAIQRTLAESKQKYRTKHGTSK
jgi:DNA modification methylase